MSIHVSYAREGVTVGWREHQPLTDDARMNRTIKGRLVKKIERAFLVGRLKTQWSRLRSVTGNRARACFVVYQLSDAVFCLQYSAQ